eukprot:PhM_4_TR1960/c1_g1_i1/m.96284/K00621/GNPNAT1, GNA1; glucosamine-phosphate N-acetyltransferase
MTSVPLPNPLTLRDNRVILFRELSVNDYSRGPLELLSKLTSVGDVTEEQFISQVKLSQRLGKYTLVAVHDDRVVAMAAVIIEPKLTRNCGFVGHIEDVVVDDAFRGTGLGREVIDRVCEYGFVDGRCYKIILDCAESNQGFYEKCGFQRKEIQMRRDATPAARI